MSGEAPLIAPQGEIDLRAPSQNPRPLGPILAPQEASPPVNPVAQAMQSIEAGHRRQLDEDLMRVFRSTLATDPDLAAEARQKGIDLGIDTRITAGNLEKVRELWEARRYQAFLRSGGNPYVMRRMLDPEFAELARDDVDQLTVIDQIVNQWSAGRLGNERSMLHYKQSQQGGYLSRDDRERLEEIDLQLLKLPKDSAGHGPLSFVYGGTRMAGGMAETVAWSIGNSLAAGGTAFALGQAGPQIGLPEELVTVPSAMAFAGLSTLGVMSGRQIAGETYGEMRRLGIIHGLAQEKAQVAGAVGGILEAGALRLAGGRIAAHALKNYLASRAAAAQLTTRTAGKAVRDFALAYGASAGAEVGVEVAQELVAWGLTSRAMEQTAPEDQEQLRPELRGELDIGGVVAETMRGVAILSAFGPALQFRNNMRAANQSQITEQRLNEFAAAVDGSKLRERAPDVFLDFLEQTVADGGAPPSVLFDLDTFTEQMTEAGVTMHDLDRSAPKVAAALRSAEAEHLGTIEIPTGEFGAKFLATDFGKHLIPHARVDPDGMTAAEGVLFQEGAEKMQKEALKLLQDDTDTAQQFRDELAEIKKAMHSQLLAAGAEPRAAVTEADLYSHFVAVMADRLEMLPAEFEAKHGLAVSGEQEVEGDALSAGERRGRYIPTARRAILSENADPSTVMHEMLHHFSGVMLDVARAGVDAAPVEILADVDTMMQFWKIAGATPEERLAAWNAMTFEEQAPHQESLAYNFELWLFNGTAPTSGLRRLFERIRTFMIGVYTSLVEAQRRLSGAYQSAFGVELPGMTPELREMFERMVAGEKAAQQAVAVRDLGPLFESEEDFIAAGHTPEEWAAYQQKLEDARQQMITDLNVRSLRAMQWQARARGRILRDLQRQHRDRRKKVREEMREQVEGEPVYRVLDLFRQDKTGLDRDEVRTMLGDIDEDAWEAVRKKLGRAMRTTGGLPVDFVADFFEGDFENGQALVAALIAARPIKEEIELRTDKEMERRYGEPLTEEAINDGIEKAIHNEARARFVAAELAFLEGVTRPTRVMVAAARAAAQQILNSRRINDMSPHKFAALESRAAVAAARAMKPVAPRKATEKTPEVKGRGADQIAAIDAKRRQLLYNQLTKLAIEAKEEIGKAERLFRKVARGTEKKLAERGRDPNIVQVARAILGQYGLLPRGAAERTIDYMDRLAVYMPEFLERYSEELGRAQDAGRAVDFDYKLMRFDDFRALREIIESLWFQSRKQHQIEVEGQRMEIADVVAELRTAGLDARARKTIPGESSAVGHTPIKTALLKGKAALTKVEHYLRELDGGKIGPFTRYLFLGVKEAVNAYRADALIYTKQLVDAVKDLRARGLLPDTAIAANELGKNRDGTPVYTFGGRKSKAGGMTELLGALLHTGNESNRSKFLVAGRGGTAAPWADVQPDGSINYSRWDAFIARLVATGVLKREHFDFIQGVWDLLERIKPKLQAAHMKLEGYTFKEVKADPFTITFPDGTEKTYRGGYVPAGVDYERAREIAQSGPAELTQEQLRGEFFEGLPKVSKGMTIERVEKARKRPLTMDMTQIVAHIDKALRYAHVEPAADGVRRLLVNEEFRAAMSAVDPAALDDIFVPFLERAVTQSLYVQGLSATADFFKHFRRMAGVAMMAGNVVNTLQQFTGLVNATRYVSVGHLKSGLMTFLRRRREMIDEIAAQSSFMDDRLRNQMFELTDDMRGVVLNRTMGEKVQAKATSLAYYLQASAQNILDVMVWKGAFDQAIERAPAGETVLAMERRAIREADQAVRLSQGSFSPEDVAAYEKGTPGGRAWTQFTSYFNTVLNQVMFAQKGERLKTAIVAFTVPMVIAEAIAMTFYDRWDDDDEDGYVDAGVFAELLIGSQARGAAAMVPAIGPNVVNLLEQVLTTRPTMGDRVVGSPMHATLARSAYGMLKAISDVADENPGIKGRSVRDVITFAAMLYPYGGAAVAPLARPLGYLAGVGTGETEPTGPADFARGLATGYASEASRTGR